MLLSNDSVRPPGGCPPNAIAVKRRDRASCWPQRWIYLWKRASPPPAPKKWQSGLACPKARLFLYFTSKEELFKAVVRENISGRYPELGDRTRLLLQATRRNAALLP